MAATRPPAQGPRGMKHVTLVLGAGGALHLTEEEPEARGLRRSPSPRSQETGEQGSGHRRATSRPVSPLCSVSVSTAVPAPPHQPCPRPEGLQEVLLAQSEAAPAA